MTSWKEATGLSSGVSRFFLANSGARVPGGHRLARWRVTFLR